MATLFCILDYFVQASLGIISSQVMSYFNITAFGLGILGASYYYAYLLMQIPAGYLLGRYGGRYVETSAIFIVAVGLFIFSSTHYFLIACFSRFLIGFGSAFAFLGALYMAEHYFPHRYFTFLAGVIQLSVSLGAILGEAPLAYVMKNFNWRLTLMMLSFAIFIFVILFYRTMRSVKHEAVVKVESARGIVTTLKNPQVIWICLVGMFSWVPATTVILWGVPYIVHLYNLSTPQAGMLCLAFWLSLCVGSPLLGWISDLTQHRKTLLIFSFICGSVGSLLLILVRNPSYLLFVFILICLGIMASMQSFSFGLIKDNVKKIHFNLAAGFCNMIAILGGAITQPVIGLILKLHSHNLMVNHQLVYSTADFKVAFSLLSCVSIGGLIVSVLFIRETNCRQYDEATEIL